MRVTRSSEERTYHARDHVVASLQLFERVQYIASNICCHLIVLNALIAHIAAQASNCILYRGVDGIFCACVPVHKSIVRGWVPPALEWARSRARTSTHTSARTDAERRIRVRVPRISSPIFASFCKFLAYMDSSSARAAKKPANASTAAWLSAITACARAKRSIVVPPCGSAGTPAVDAEAMAAACVMRGCQQQSSKDELRAAAEIVRWHQNKCNRYAQ